MPIEPAPLADPHSTEVIVAETAPRTAKTVVQGLVFVIVGVLFLKAGVNGLDLLLERVRYWSPTYAFGIYRVIIYGMDLWFTLFFCSVGAVLIWQGVLLWKYGR